MAEKSDPIKVLAEWEPIQKDPSRHYLLCEINHQGNTKGILSEYMSRQSPTRPGDRMYRMESDRLIDTNNDAMRLISCTIEDYEAWVKMWLDESKSRLVRPQMEEGDNSDTSIVRGPVAALAF